MLLEKNRGRREPATIKPGWGKEVEETGNSFLKSSQDATRSEISNFDPCSSQKELKQLSSAPAFGRDCFASRFTNSVELHFLATPSLYAERFRKLDRCYPKSVSIRKFLEKGPARPQDRGSARLLTLSSFRSVSVMIRLRRGSQRSSSQMRSPIYHVLLTDLRT